MYSNPIGVCVCMLNKIVDILKQIALIDFVFIFLPRHLSHFFSVLTIREVDLASAGINISEDH